MSKQNPWLFPAFPSYYDVNTSAVQRHAETLGRLSGRDRGRALEQISEAVMLHAQKWDDKQLAGAAISMADDLYKYGCTAESWDGVTADYVAAVWGSIMRYVAERGFQVRYVVDNTWPDGLQRPLQLFPLLFPAAGLIYLCPQAFATETQKAEGDDAVENLASYIVEGRMMAKLTVQLADSRGSHFLYLEADFAPGSLDTVLGLPSRAGTISIFRTEPGIPHSRIEVRVTPLA